MNSTTRLVSLSSLLFALLFSSTALAGDQLRNLGEKAKDRQDIRQDNRQLKDNAVSVDRLDNLIDKWNDARLRNPNSPEVSRLGQELAEVMQHDLAISARQVANANKEVREANREVRSDRRKKKRSDRQELSDAANRGDEQAKRRAERELRDDRRDLRDDRRDRRDDKHDQSDYAELLRSKKAVFGQLAELQASGSPATDRHHELLLKYSSLMKQEQRLTLSELHEDRRELREDRRETREDRRQD